jgi:hypothetical protein
MATRPKSEEIAMKKMALIGLSALLAVFAPNVVSAQVGTITPTFCSATAAGPTPGNVVISGIPDKVQFTVNKQKVNAICHFEDISGIFEANAEQQQLVLCTIATGSGVFRGVGHVVASASPQRPTGGNATIVCHADVP